MPLSGGYEEGYDDGYKEGYVVGEGDGYVKGETDGKEIGYDEGYDKGYSDCREELGDIFEPPIITGNCDNMFQKNQWSFYINRFNSQIRTENITSVLSMFEANTGIEEIKFDLNFKPSSYISFNKLFSSATNLKRLPKLKGAVKVTTFTSMFSNCQQLNHIDDDYLDCVDLEYMRSRDCSCSAMFSSCESLREIPSFVKSWEGFHYYGPYGITTSTFSGCSSLNEIVDFPAPNKKAMTSDGFAGAASNCFRIKEFIFKTNNGTPFIVEWKTQTLDLSRYVGYCSRSSDVDRICGYLNSGITEDKLVTDEKTYQALKNDPDWLTSKVEYSRYNRNSAVNTINSLPDTSAYLATAGGTNTIKFKGNAGSATDGGAINTLTAEEIAVATAKGWTVTFA
jgi:hypothetical protein